MSLTFDVRIGKKRALYLPKRLAEALNLKEGSKAKLRLSGDSAIIEPVHDPIELALSSRKFAALTPEQVEAISREEQSRRHEVTT